MPRLPRGRPIMQFRLRPLLLLSASVVATQPVAAAQSTSPASSSREASPDNDDEDIVVTGTPPRGSVIGDIAPLNILSSKDVKATGATSFDELLEAIAPDVGVALGSGSARPLVLLNGHRVSSYRELRDIPIEAVSRVDILPQEVALKYGYPPDQKVVNVVLQNRFEETVAQASLNRASQKGYTGGGGDLTRILLSPNQRMNFNLHAGTADILRGSQRALIAQQYESVGTGETGLLLPPELGFRGTGTITRELPRGIETSLNIEADHSNGHLLGGLSEQLPAELQRQTIDDRLHVGAMARGDNRQWHWNVTANGDIERNHTSTSQLGVVYAPGNARSTREAGSIEATASGPLFVTAQGNVDVTFHAAVSGENLDIDEEHFANRPSGSTARSTVTAGANIDVPVSHRGRAFGALGNLTFNGNAEIDQLSDFGTLTRFGVGTNWSPVAGLNFVGSWNHEEQAPTVRQLGDPFVETPGTRIFDFTNGEVNRVAVLTGGNPYLQTDRRNTFDISAEWQPITAVDFRLRADYAHMGIDHPISNITVFKEMEVAFPERFMRDSSGNLLSVDLRPVNFESADRDALRLGFDFTKPLRSKKVSQADVQRLVDRARSAGIKVPQSSGSSGTGGGESLGSAVSSNGRLSFSLTDTITLVDRAVIRPDLPALDYLHGAPIGQTGGQPRHQVQAQAGWSNYGMGVRVGANWRSATSVKTFTGESFRFSPVATFDLRLFANVGQYLPIVSRHPWLRGASMRFEVGNVFNSRPSVHTRGGIVPLGYEPGILDPLGRTFMLTFRKQFLPTSFYQQQLQKFEQQQSQQ